MELNNITNTGTWGEQATRLNDNFNKVALGIDTLQEMYKSLSQNAPEVVDTLPQTGEANKIYRLVGTTSYSDYMYNANDLNTPILMATYDNAIDDKPTAGSDNLVKSGGVYGSYMGEIDLTNTNSEAIWTTLADKLPKTKCLLIGDYVSPGSGHPMYLYSTDSTEVQLIYSTIPALVDFSNYENYQLYTYPNNGDKLHFITNPEVINRYIKEPKLYQGIKRISNLTDMAPYKNIGMSANGSELFICHNGGAAHSLFPHSSSTDGFKYFVKPNTYDIFEADGDYYSWDAVNNKFTPIESKIHTLEYDYTETDGSGVWAFAGDFSRYVKGRKAFLRLRIENKLTNITDCTLNNGSILYGEKWSYVNNEISSTYQALYFSASQPTKLYLDYIILDESNFEYEYLTKDYLTNRTLLFGANKNISNYAPSSSSGTYSPNDEKNPNRSILKYPVRAGEYWCYFGRGYFYTICLENANGELEVIKSSVGFFDQKDEFAFTIPYDGYLYAWSANGLGFLKKITPNYDILDIAYSFNKIHETFENVTIRKDYTFASPANRYSRQVWYIPMDVIKYMLTTIGYFNVYLKISATSNASAGTIYVVDSTSKTSVPLYQTSDPTWPYSTGNLVQISINWKDYMDAVGFSMTEFPIIWQYGGNSTPSVTYKVHELHYILEPVKYCQNICKSVQDYNKFFELPYRGFSSMNQISVKKDGSGDFTEIQAAINSITDASVTKQYVINVYDDFEINNLTELWKVNSPTVRNVDVSPAESIALVILKDWIHIRGIGSPKRLYVESPNIDMAGSCFQNIQTIYPKGNCSIDNFYVGIKGGRYAIHQEAGGSTTSPDYHATTYYKNLVVEHKGNYMYTHGASWDSTMAQANGTAAGLKVIYENVKWISDCNIPFYTHTNLQDGATGFDEPNEVTFINCSMVTTKNVSLANFSPYWGDIGSNQIARIKFVGCNIPKFDAGLGNNRGLEPVAIRKDAESGGARVTGQGNATMTAFINQYKNNLILQTTDNNKNIDVVGGTAYDLIWGGNIRKYNGTSDAKGVVFGKRFYNTAQSWASSTPSQVYTLAHLLGNCAESPKTLIVSVDGNQYTITFNKNYVTSDGSSYTSTTVPAYSNSQIINEINSAYPNIFTCVPDSFELYSFDDCQEEGVNRSNYTIASGDAVCRDYSNGFNSWRLCGEGEIADGIAGCRINPSEEGHDSVGNIVLSDKAYFMNAYIGIPNNATVGSKWAMGSDKHKNWIQSSTNATFVVFSNGYCKRV